MKSILLFITFAASVALSQTPSPVTPDFAARVQDYLTLRKGVQSVLPQQKPTKKRKQIQERQAALAQKLREARASAKQGDLFTPEVTAQVRQVIQSAFQGPNARYVRKTIREGAPVDGWKLSVNADYPEHLPLTTVPPTILLHLPQLPKELAYHIIGHDFVVMDTEARMVIDFIAGAIP